ncbi:MULTISPECIES: hypothetical protein [unclassified Pseudomonas]|uniref:hypothetical protein n=1 Tax=unclassified Pseudomonas TaxID=196821 RepID=UPI00128DEB12|nr:MULTISPECIES: hypothetical protein [unclassified Pseudomonas]MPQ68318.1 hypothetical protein [Pseudomonas sp. MWU12-2323]
MRGYIFFAAALLVTLPVAAAPEDLFDTMPVYSIAARMPACSKTIGMPAGIFGDDESKKPNLTSRVRNDGQVMMVRDLRENGDIYISQFFLDKKQCLQAIAEGAVSTYTPSPKSSNWWYHFDGEVKCLPISYTSSKLREPADFALKAKKNGYHYDVVKFSDSYILEDKNRKSVIWFQKGQENCESVARDLLKERAY